MTNIFSPRKRAQSYGQDYQDNKYYARYLDAGYVGGAIVEIELTDIDFEATK